MNTPTIIGWVLFAIGLIVGGVALVLGFFATIAEVRVRVPTYKILTWAVPVLLAVCGLFLAVAFAILRLT